MDTFNDSDLTATICGFVAVKISGDSAGEKPHFRRNKINSVKGDQALMFIKDFREYGQLINGQYKHMLTMPGRKDDEAFKLIQKKNRLMQDMMRFVLDGDWARKSTREKFRFFVSHNYDYELICKMFNTRRKCVDVFVSRCNKRLSEVLSEPMHYLKADKPEKACAIFNASVGLMTAERDLGYDLSDLLPEPARMPNVRITDCPVEINILRVLLKNNMEEMIMKGDRKKLAHLLYVLNCNNQAYLHEKADLMTAIRG